MCFRIRRTGAKNVDALRLALIQNGEIFLLQACYGTLLPAYHDLHFHQTGAGMEGSGLRIGRLRERSRRRGGKYGASEEAPEPDGHATSHNHWIFYAFAMLKSMQGRRSSVKSLSMC